jgi:hypothetical protein
VPPGMVIRHKVCDLRHCVRDDHLLPGTHQNNMDDMVEHGRSSSPRPPVSAVVKAAMRRDHEDGLSYVGLVEKYGVSYATVNRTLQAARVSARKD